MEVAELVVKIGADLDEVTKGVELVNDKLDKLKEKNKQGGGFDALEKIATGALYNIGASATNIIGGALGKIWEFGAGAITMASDYEAAMNRIQVIGQATNKEMEGLSETFKETGQTFGAASALDAAKTYETLLSRGFDLDQAQQQLNGTMQLGVAGMLDYSDAAVIMDNVLSGYKDQAIDAADVTDVLAATYISSGASIQSQGEAYEQFASVANAANISLKDSATSMALLEKAGIGGEKGGTALRSALMSLQGPSKEAKGLMDSFGISIYDAEGAMKSWPEIIQEFQKLETGSQVVMRASQAELDKYQKEADATQKRLEALGESNAGIAQQMADDQARLTKAAEDNARRRAQAEEDYNDKIAQLQSDANSKRVELENQLSSQLTTIEVSHAEKLEQIAQASSEKRTSIEQSYGEKLADIATSYQNKIADITQNFNDKLADADSKLQQKQQQLATDHAAKLADIQTKAAQKREDLQRDLGEKLQDLQKSYQRKIADLQSSYEQKQADATEKYQSNLEKLESDHLSKLDSIRQKSADLTSQYQIGQLRKEQDYQRKLLDLKSDQEKKEKKLADNFAESQLDRQLGHEEKVASIQEDYGDKIADIQEKLANTRRRSEREALEKQLAETIAARDKALAKENSDFQRSQEQAKRKYDLQLQQAQQAYADQVAETEAKYALEEARRKEDYDRQLAAYADQLTAETKAYSDRREAAKASYEAQQADLDAQRKAALDQAKQAYTEQQTTAQTAYQRALDDLKISIDRQNEAEQAAFAQRKKQAQDAYTEQQNELAKQRNKALSDAQTDQQKRLNDAQTAYQRQLDELASSLAKQTQAEQTAYDKQRSQAQSANAQKLVEVENNLNQQLTKLDAGYTKQEQRAKEAYERSFSELSGQVHRRATEMQKEMEDNNKSISEQKSKLDTLNKTLATQGERLTTVTQEIRDNAAVTLFGAEGSSVYHNVIRAGLPVFDEMKLKISQQGKAAELSDAQMKGAAGATAEMTSNFETFMLEIGNEALPTFTEGMRTLTKIIQENGPVVKAFTKDTIIPLADKALEVAKGFIESGDKIGYIKDKIIEYAPKIATEAGKIIPLMVKELDKYSGIIGSAAANLLEVATKKFIEKGPEWGQSLLDGLWGYLVAANEKDPIVLWFSKMWQSIKDWWGINSPSTKMMEIAGYLLDGLWKGITQGPQKIYDAMADIGNKIKDKITERFGQFTTVGSELLGKVREGVLNKSGEIYSLMTNIGMQAKDKLAKWYGAFTDVGRSLVDGIKSGMDSKWGNLKQEVVGWAFAMPQWFKNIWDIHSPSGVMEEIAGELPAGVEVGIDANADKATNALSRMSDKMQDVFALPELPPVRPYLSDTLAPLAAAPASAIIPRPQATIVNNYYYQTIEGNVWAERDLIEAMRDGLQERGRVNGYEVKA